MHNPRYHGSVRAALAPIELLMALPLLAILLLITLTIASGGLAMLGTQLAARNQASSHPGKNGAQRVPETTSALEKARKLTRPFHVATRDIVPPSGQVVGHATTQLDFGFAPLLDHLPAVERSHTELTGTWDYHALEFAAEDQHLPLCLEPRLTAFCPKGFQVSIFQQLVP